MTGAEKSVTCLPSNPGQASRAHISTLAPNQTTVGSPRWQNGPKLVLASCSAHETLVGGVHAIVLFIKEFPKSKPHLKYSIMIST